MNETQEFSITVISHRRKLVKIIARQIITRLFKGVLRLWMCVATVEPLIEGIR